jgi:hypothetical protein
MLGNPYKQAIFHCVHSMHISCYERTEDMPGKVEGPRPESGSPSSFSGRLINFHKRLIIAIIMRNFWRWIASILWRLPRQLNDHRWCQRGAYEVGHHLVACPGLQYASLTPKHAAVEAKYCVSNLRPYVLVYQGAVEPTRQ